MLFNSAGFLFVFLPATVLIFFVVARVSPSFALVFLTLSSVAFYAQTNSEYLLILIPSVVVNFAIGSALARLKDNERQRFALVTLGIVANLACLLVFKYLDFVIITVNRLLHTEPHPLKIELPLGISFFTFTQIAFLVDAYQRKVHEAHFVKYALFVSYFPHLVAGPILHHGEMMPQFSNRSIFRPVAENFAVGLSVFLIGLFKKVVIADALAPQVHKVFDAAAQGTVLSTWEGWSGALSYALQIYFDFSGYSDMAIGLSLLFGVRLPLNFNSPYKATNIIDFWRRWHMTLSRFLRDYLYVPLGGNRAGESRRLANLMIVMLLGGLWHGASWTFVIWGGLHGIYLTVNHAWRRWFGATPASNLVSIAVGRVVTLFFVTVAWVFFRAPNMHTAVSVIKSMFAWRVTAPGSPIAAPQELVLIAAGALAIAWFLPNTQEVMSLYKPALDGPVAGDGRRPTWLLWRPNVLFALIIGLMALMSLVAIVFEKRVGDFIYFQF